MQLPSGAGLMPVDECASKQGSLTMDGVEVELAVDTDLVYSCGLSMHRLEARRKEVEQSSLRLVGLVEIWGLILQIGVPCDCVQLPAEPNVWRHLGAKNSHATGPEAFKTKSPLEKVQRGVISAKDQPDEL